MATRDQSDSESVGGVRRTYTAPILKQLIRADELIELLGPAQAAYGGSGLP